MTVIDLVDDPASEPETVVEEVRPGYVWRGRVVRFAEVRAVGSRVAARAREMPSPGEERDPSPGDQPATAANETET